MGFSCWEFRRSVPGGLWLYREEFNSADEDLLSSNVMSNVGLNLFGWNQTHRDNFQMLDQNFFYYSKDGRRGNPPTCIPLKPSTKQERSALWIFLNFLRNLSMCFGTRRAETVCPWPERLIPDQSWSALAGCSCMGEKQSWPQSMSLPTRLLLALSKLGGFASIFLSFSGQHADVHSMVHVLDAAP